MRFTKSSMAYLFSSVEFRIKKEKNETQTREALLHIIRRQGVKWVVEVVAMPKFCHKHI